MGLTSDSGKTLIAPAARGIAAGAQAHALPAMGSAFGHTFMWSFCMVIVALTVALFIRRAAPDGAPAAAQIIVE